MGALSWCVNPQSLPILVPYHSFPFIHVMSLSFPLSGPPHYNYPEISDPSLLLHILTLSPRLQGTSEDCD
jgi:hypothetical protein